MSYESFSSKPTYKLDKRSNLEIISQRFVLVELKHTLYPEGVEYYGNTITLTHRVIPETHAAILREV